MSKTVSLDIFLVTQSDYIQQVGDLTDGQVDTLIERVYVYPGNRLDIEWKSKDFCAEGLV